MEGLRFAVAIIGSLSVLLIWVSLARTAIDVRTNAKDQAGEFFEV